jgi:hypothetical protein
LTQGDKELNPDCFVLRDDPKRCEAYRTKVSNDESETFWGESPAVNLTTEIVAVD